MPYSHLTKETNVPDHQNATPEEIVLREHLAAMKLATEAFIRRFRAQGINTYDHIALLACREAIRKATDEVFDVDTHTWKKPL